MDTNNTMNYYIVWGTPVGFVTETSASIAIKTN